MRTILIPVADRPECAVALSCAFDLSKRLSSNLLGYHLRPHVREKRTAVAEKQIKLASKDAHSLFNRMAEGHGLELKKRPTGVDPHGQALWRELTGSPEKCFPFIGPMSDLIVVSRPRTAKSVTAGKFMHAALMLTGTPVLMLPSRQPKTLGTHVLICWNQSVEAAAAVKANLPLLAAAGAVTIIAAGNEDGVGAKSTHLQQYLRHYGIKSQRVATRGLDAEKEIMDTYKEHGCDLLLMGAYSKPRWQERVFGGVTTFVLNKTSIPAVMLHR